MTVEDPRTPDEVAETYQEPPEIVTASETLDDVPLPLPDVSASVPVELEPAQIETPVQVEENTSTYSEARVSALKKEANATYEVLKQGEKEMKEGYYKAYDAIRTLAEIYEKLDGELRKTTF